jgi:predicted phosphatase
MPPEIVPVDDNDGDIRLIREVLGEVNKTALLQVPHISDYTHPCDFISSR